MASSGLLVVPSAPSPIDLIGNSPGRILMVRRSNDTMDSDEFLDAGTPPPSYAEVLACISTPAVNELESDTTRGKLLVFLLKCIVN